MNKIFLFICFQLICFTALSQTNENATETPREKVGENSIIIDELGNHYSYKQWRAISVNKNHYLSRRKEGDKEIFVIKKLTEEQKLRSITASKKPKPSPAFTEGEKFKYFDIKTLNGEKIKKQDLEGKVLVFNFWFINCPPCRKEIPDLNNLTEKYKDQKDVLFLGVALDEVYEIKEFLKKQNFDYTQLRNGREICSNQEIKSYPTHLIVGKDGNIQFSSQGLALNTFFWIDKTIKEAL